MIHRREQKGRGFAGAGLRLPLHVVPFQGVGQGRRLDGGAEFEARVPNAAKKLGGQVEAVKGDCCQ